MDREISFELPKLRPPQIPMNTIQFVVIGLIVIILLATISEGKGGVPQF